MRQTAKQIIGTLRSARPQNRIHASSRLVVSDNAGPIRGGIIMGRNSSLIVEEGAQIDSAISIGDNCTVTLHQNSRILNTNFSVTNDSTVELGEGAIINSPVSPMSSVTVDNGSLALGRRAHIMSCEVLVRFGGKMTIGSYTGIAYGSELRCEEQLDIGSYAMISYGVCIYDTNTHSLDWRERRARIEHCYPEGVWEETKPITSPVVIGDDVWIGKQVTITKGARIGNRCIIGIRSTIGSGVIEDDSIVVAPKSRIINRQAGSNSSLNPNE